MGREKQEGGLGQLGGLGKLSVVMIGGAIMLGGVHLFSRNLLKCGQIVRTSVLTLRQLVGGVVACRIDIFSAVQRPQCLLPFT